MLQSIGVDNFKSWQSAEAIELSPITAFFGANSSGKSSLLHLLILLKRSVESSDKGQVLDFRRPADGIDFGSFQEVLFNHNLEKQLTVRVVYKPRKPLLLTDPSTNKAIVKTEDPRVEFTCGIRQLKDGTLAVEEMTYRYAGHSFSMRRDSDRRHYKLEHEGEGFEFVRTRGRPWDLTSPTRFYKFSDQVTFRYQNADFLTELESSFQAALENVYHLGPLRDLPIRRYSWPGGEPADLGPKGERWIDALLAARSRGKYISPGYRKKRLSLEERVALWLRDLGLIHSFDVERIADDSNVYRVKVRRDKDSAPVLLPDVGFGVSQVLPVLITLYYVPEGSTVLLEQPEIHLHPAVQAKLADVIIDAMLHRNIQVILESHSEHLLYRLQRRIAEEAISTDQISLYFVHRTEAGNTDTLSLDIDMFGVVRNWPPDFFGDQVEDLAAAAQAAASRRLGSK